MSESDILCLPTSSINEKIDSLLIKVSWVATFFLLAFSLLFKYQQRVWTSNTLFNIQINALFVFCISSAFLAFHVITGQESCDETFMLLFYRLFDGTRLR